MVSVRGNPTCRSIMSRVNCRRCLWVRRYEISKQTEDGPHEAERNWHVSKQRTVSIHQCGFRECERWRFDIEPLSARLQQRCRIPYELGSSIHAGSRGGGVSRPPRELPGASRWATRAGTQRNRWDRRPGFLRQCQRQPGWIRGERNVTRVRRAGGAFVDGCSRVCGGSLPGTVCR